MLVDPGFTLRVVVAFSVIEMCSTRGPLKKTVAVGPTKYPLEVHHLFRAQLAKKQAKPNGVWSAWSSWSSCSRSCGGGITQQTRHCISRPADSRFGRGQRRRRQQDKWEQQQGGGSACVGLYKRIHICNTQSCPGGRDFRTEQCQAFNGRPFKGKLYFWEPYSQAGDECALNCRAVGMDFYATLNRTVVDGTSCSKPYSSHGRRAPSGTRGICIGGYCKSVSSNGVVGSLDANPEECAACMKGTCRSFNGLYTRSDLPTGYSLVTQIPHGACRISIQQLKHTKNFIALRDANGSFILNGDWKFSASRSVEAAGTRFTYLKQDATSLETITAPGPLSNPVDILIVYFQANQGIKYSFSLPVTDQPPEQIAPPYLKKPLPASDASHLDPRRLDPPPSVLSQRDEPPRPPIRDEIRPGHAVHRRQRRRKFVWKITGVTACSKSCGGGVQTTVVTCIREYTQTPVLDRRCANVEKPAPHPIKCNVQDCPPHWGGYWGSCSGSCGQGVQKYISQCEQESNGRTAVIEETACPKPRPQETSRACALSPCEDTIDNELHQRPDVSSTSKTGSFKEWTIGSWSQCSVSCGTGYRSRSVSCPSGQCHPENRPIHAEYCEAGACSSTPGQVSPWLVTEWSQCSELCGTGSQTRFAYCTSNSKEKCDSKPEISRACSSDKMCSGQWFTGPWGPCSNSCSAPALQKREVLCIVKVRGHSRITNEMTCPAHERPSSEQACAGTCPAQWFTGEWGDCICPVGVQRREVRCLDASSHASQACAEDSPISKRTCGCAKKEEEPVRDEPVDLSCRDKIRNCHLAVQARLCQYPYYISHCCVSCRKAQELL